MKIKKSYRWAFKNGSGKIDGKVLYTRGGKTYMRKTPVKTIKVPSANQESCREKFKAAHVFGKMVVNDPDLKATYTSKAAGKCTAYCIAVSEYMKSH